MDIKSIVHCDPIKYGKRSYPSWAIVIDWIIDIIPILMIPVGLLHSILSTEDTMSQAIVNKEWAKKMYASNSVPTTRFRNNLHQVPSKSTIGKRNMLKVLGARKPKVLSRIAKLD